MGPKRSHLAIVVIFAGAFVTLLLVSLFLIKNNIWLGPWLFGLSFVPIIFALVFLFLTSRRSDDTLVSPFGTPEGSRHASYARLGVS